MNGTEPPLMKEASVGAPVEPVAAAPGALAPRVGINSGAATQDAWRLALVFGFPALALYNTTLAVFAVVIAGLRLVRESHDA